MPGSSYEIAPIFLIRMAGVPFDVLTGVATRDSSRIARELIARRTEYAAARAEAEKVVHSRERLLTPDAYHALRLALRSNAAPSRTAQVQPPVFTNYATAAAAVDRLESELEATLQREVQLARAALVQASRSALLAKYLVFGAENVRGLLAKQLGDYPADLTSLASRNNAARKIEQSLLLYLQRVAAKNDTFSEFGPSGWGTSNADVDGVAVEPVPGIARREIFHERWTAHGLAAVMNAESEIFEEMRPRLNPNGRIHESGGFVFTDTGEAIALSEDELALVAQCDGETAVHALDRRLVEGLVRRKVLACAMEVPALDPHAFDVLQGDVQNWRAGAARDKWSAILRPMTEAAQKFGATEEPALRATILDEERARLHAIGGAQKVGQRFLYSATNVIGEECVRDCNFRINDALLNEVATEAAPWIDLWRDSYAFVASRVAAGLRGVLERAGAADDAMPLPAFLRVCAEARLPLTGPGLVALATIAFQEVKAAFRARLAPHAADDEYELTIEDCHIVRRQFEYPKFDEYTYPSADLQISAESPDAVRAGDYQWIIGELHPPVALLHHGFYWGCPDKAALNQAFASTVFDKPNCHFGFFAADFTAHTTVRIHDALPQLTNFVAPQRANRNWRSIPPSEADVYVDPASGDVAVRHFRTHEHLGSFARAWVIPLGFHPFSFSLAPHMPRLRCGNVIVQRRSWTVAHDELAPGNYTGVSRALVLAVEKLRAAKEWPRYIYIRPTEQALRRSGAEGRDKDTKPVFIDLESYLFIEIFHRWLAKAGELEVTEMLPDPDHLMWPESDGRRTFELRTQIVPRS